MPTWPTRTKTSPAEPGASWPGSGATRSAWALPGRRDGRGELVEHLSGPGVLREIAIPVVVPVAQGLLGQVTQRRLRVRAGPVPVRAAHVGQQLVHLAGPGVRVPVRVGRDERHAGLEGQDHAVEPGYHDQVVAAEGLAERGGVRPRQVPDRRPAERAGEGGRGRRVVVHVVDGDELDRADPLEAGQLGGELGGEGALRVDLARAELAPGGLEAI